MKKNKKIPASVWAFARIVLAGYWLPLIIIQTALIWWAATEILYPMFWAKIVDTFTLFAQDRIHVLPTLLPLVAITLFLWLSVEIVWRIAGYTGAYIYPRIIANTRTYLFNHVIRQSTQYFANKSSGNIANRIIDMPDALLRIIEKITIRFTPTICSIITAIIFTIPVSTKITLLILAWIIVHLSVCIYNAQKCVLASTDHSRARSTLAGKIVDSVTNNNIVRLFNRGDFESNYVGNYQEEECVMHHRSRITVERIKIILGISLFVGLGLGINFLVYREWILGYLSVGNVVYIFNVTGNLLMQVWSAGSEIPEFFKDVGICMQGLALLQEQETVSDAPGASQLSISSGEIIFNHVSFRYEEKAIIFDNVSVKIPGGQKVGLVGYSGSGKTTFVNLILRLFDLQNGAIYIDGQNILNVTQQSLRETISFIPQDPGIFDRSILQNIQYGNLNASMSQIHAAAQSAQAHNFIERLSNKYETIAGEKGNKLSGGQKQRLAIARALIKNSSIVIMDEATSAQDAITEHLIQERLLSLLANKTTLIIAHRLTTLKGVDRILVFDKGNIVEDGSHDQLLQSDTLYKTLWDSQINGFIFDKNSQT